VYLVNGCVISWGVNLGRISVVFERNKECGVLDEDKE